METKPRVILAIVNEQEKGFYVKTARETIQIVVDAATGQLWCGKWRYMATDEDLSGHIGATLLDVLAVDTQFRVKSLGRILFDPQGGDWKDTIMSANLLTDKGVLQLWGHAPVEETK